MALGRGGAGSELAYRVAIGIGDVKVATPIESHANGSIQPGEGGARRGSAGGELAHRVAKVIGDVKIATTVEGQVEGGVQSGEGGTGGGGMPGRTSTLLRLNFHQRRKGCRHKRHRESQRLGQTHPGEEVAAHRRGGRRGTDLLTVPLVGDVRYWRRRGCR